MEEKLKHLEMVQGVVNRMANSSFLLKGWSVTIVAALLALSVTTREKIALVSISFLPLLVFWILDGYYLWQERLFRKVYDKVSKLKEDEIDFSMNTKFCEEGSNTWLASIFSITILVFYLSLAITMLIVIIILKNM